jgi:hypothetical protein
MADADRDNRITTAMAGGISYNKGTVALSVQRNFQFALKLLF